MVAQVKEAISWNVWGGNCSAILVVALSISSIFCLSVGTRRDPWCNPVLIGQISSHAMAILLFASWTLVSIIIGFVVHINHSARSISRSVWEGPGQPYLVPCRTTHRRFFPKKHSFSYSYLTVGVPVGFGSERSGMISVVEQKHQSSTRSLLLSRWLPQSWYTIRACDHLQRSQHDLDLRQKLDRYLQAEGHNPTDYPYAYLITAPRFAGYSFNQVSLWYLYSSAKILSAMILEVNNTYDERRPYLLLRESNSELKRPGLPARIQGSRVKDLYVSPFNSRKGHYSVVSTDPLGPGMLGFSGLDVKITLRSSKGHPKLLTRLFSEVQAVDPSTLGFFTRLKFLATWSWIGFATAPRIVKEGIIIMYRQKLHMYKKPEPLLGTIGRHPTPSEKIHEKGFRRYLAQLVTSSSVPLTVHYFTSGLISEDKATFDSSHGKDNHDGILLEIRILSPSFYSRIVHYDNFLDGMLSEMHEHKTVSVSKPEVLSRVFGTSTCMAMA